MARFYSSSLPEKELRRLYNEEGLSTKAVAAALGCSETAVRNRLVQLGIPRRLPWQEAACDASEIRRLYVEEGLSTLAVAQRVGCSESAVRRRLIALGVQRRGVGKQLYPRHDFSGDPLERAYLIGFRLGDLHVETEGDTVVVKCTSTRTEQVHLFRELFERYGRVYTDEATVDRRRRKSIGMYARLNRSFEFLLPKQDGLPDWIELEDLAFYAFLAGYVDAEGYFKVAAERPGHAAEARLEIRSYDHALLRQLAQGLNRLGILCPSPGQRVAAGYVNRRGVRSNQSLWGLGVCRQRSLALLFERVGPHLRHQGRRNEMHAARELVIRKLGRAAAGTDRRQQRSPLLSNR